MSMFTEESVKAQAMDPRTTSFTVRRITRGGGGNICAQRVDGEEVYCGWTKKALDLVKKWWANQDD